MVADGDDCESLVAVSANCEISRCGPIFLSSACVDSHRPQMPIFPSVIPGMPAMKFSVADLVVSDQAAHAQSEVLSQPVTKIRSGSERPRPNSGWLANANHDWWLLTM